MSGSWFQVKTEGDNPFRYHSILLTGFQGLRHELAELVYCVEEFWSSDGAYWRAPTPDLYKDGSDM